MTERIMHLSQVISSWRGAFSAQVMARDSGDGSWEGWLEFTPVGKDTVAFVTGIETHQHDRIALERWASGLTRVYAEGALARATALESDQATSELLDALREIVDALDRRIPQVEHANESEIAAAAKRLKIEAVRRIAVLHRQLSGATEVTSVDVPSQRSRSGHGADPA